MKNRITAHLSAVVLAAGVTCLYSPYPCFIHAGEPAGVPMVAIIQEQEVPMAANMPGMFHIDSTVHAEEVRSAALACIAALGDEAAAVGGDSVDTGFVGGYKEAREVYAASKDWYYGNTGYSMDYVRLADGNVRLLLKTEHGTPKQAYTEHLEAEARLMGIAASFSGTDEEKAKWIFEWAVTHVSYADDATVGRIEGTEPGCVPDYTGIRATAYTAAMDGMATCDGLSTMLLALFEMNGIPAAKVQNGQHAYNIAFAGGRWVLYDAASGVSGSPEEFIRRYGSYYAPERLTCGFGVDWPAAR